MVGALHSSPEEKAASAAARRAAFIAQERQEAGASEQGSWESKDQATPEGTVSQMQQSMAALGLQTSVQSKSRCATGTLSSPGDASPSPSSSPPEPTAPSSSLADAVQTSSLIPPSPPIPMAMVASEFDGREGGCVSPSSTPYADSLKTFSSLATPYADSLKTFSSSSFLSLPLPWARDEALEKRKGGNEKVEARSASHGDESRTQGGEPSYSTLQRRCSEAEAAAQAMEAKVAQADKRLAEAKQAQHGLELRNEQLSRELNLALNTSLRNSEAYHEIARVLQTAVQHVAGISGEPLPVDLAPRPPARQQDVGLEWSREMEAALQQQLNALSRKVCCLQEANGQVTKQQVLESREPLLLDAEDKVEQEREAARQRDMEREKESEQQRQTEGELRQQLGTAASHAETLAVALQDAAARREHLEAALQEMADDKETLAAALRQRDDALLAAAQQRNRVDALCQAREREVEDKDGQLRDAAEALAYVHWSLAQKGIKL